MTYQSKQDFQGIYTYKLFRSTERPTRVREDHNSLPEKKLYLQRVVETLLSDL